MHVLVPPVRARCVMMPRYLLCCEVWPDIATSRPMIVSKCGMIFVLHEAALHLALALFVNNHIAEVGSALTSQQKLCADTICLKFLHNLLPYAVIANLSHQASINAQARGSCQGIGTVSSTSCLKHMDACFVAGIERSCTGTKSALH